MKIYVTQGHQDGIGLEVFFKSCLFLNSNALNSIQLLAYKKSVEKTLRSLKIPFEVRDEFILFSGLKISVTWLIEIKFSESFSALELGMRLAEVGGILYTLPTSKDQFPGFAGHTEYFRHFYDNPNLGMLFSSNDLQILLVTDHVGIRELPQILKQQKIYHVVKNTVHNLKKWKWPIKNILIAGLNPHAGEKGLIGNEDKEVEKAVKQLQDKDNFNVSGPFPGDTILLERKDSNDLLVYLFHDQGLGIFKGTQGFIGSNITTGLPYPRFSPDHGTSFGLMGKNVADHRGCFFSLNQAIDLLQRMNHGQDPSYQGKSS
jgi:4-hydroxythreonine-4-phosphate dehydrogenase